MILNNFVLTQQRAVRSIHEQCNNLKQQRRLLQLEQVRLQQENVTMKQIRETSFPHGLAAGLTARQYNRYPVQQSSYRILIGSRCLETTFMARSHRCSLHRETELSPNCGA